MAPTVHKKHSAHQFFRPIQHHMYVSVGVINSTNFRINLANSSEVKTKNKNFTELRCYEVEK